MVETYKDWADKLDYAMHGCRTTYKGAVDATPFSLVFGGEAVCPVEMKS